MSYILTYVRVALATSDAQSILEIPATEKQNNNAEHIAIIIIYRGVNLNEATSAEIMQTYKKLFTREWSDNKVEWPNRERQMNKCHEP